MSTVSIAFLAFALAADSFAAAVAKGSQVMRPTLRQALVVGSIFAVVQVIMPILGWRIGAKFQPMVRSFDHWIAFVILSMLGIKMILDGVRPDDIKVGKVSFTVIALILTAVATSIDALVAGFGFGVLSVSVLSILLAIGSVTFITSVGGMYIGNRLGARIGIFAEIGAGFILIGLGLRILLTHLGA